MKSGFSGELMAGRTVVITGAGRGIGLAIAEAFHACGARIIAHSGRHFTGPGLQGVADAVFEADFTDASSIAGFIDAVRAETDSIDVLINNAGTMFGRFAAGELTDEQYSTIVMLNQTAVVQITRGLLPLLRKASGASIVNTVSISATTGGSAGSAIYSATKAFVATYTKALARELGPEGIRANCVSPGTIATEFHERYSSREKLETTAKGLPLQRLGTPEDCAPAFVFLAANQLSGYVTGQTIEINGGQMII